MGIITNWKLYLAFAGVLVLFYFMYTAKIAENATLVAANKTLTETVASQKKMAELKDSIIATQEKLLINNREQLKIKSMDLSGVESKVENRPDAGDSAHPYLKELFKELGGLK